MLPTDESPPFRPANQAELGKRTNETKNDLNNNPSNNCNSDSNYGNHSQNTTQPGNIVSASSGGSGNKILNFLNTRNNFLSSYKLSEDELFTDLKSRFIEKHLRTILRSQGKSPPAENTNGNDPGGGGGGGENGKNSDDSQVNVNVDKDASNPLLNPLRIITVERPEPQLDVPRDSYLKSTKLKLLKMHDQVKSRVAERYRKFCTSFRTTVLPQLRPIRIFVEVVLSNLCFLLVAPFGICAVILLMLSRLCVGIVLKIRYKGRFHLMDGADAAWAHQYYANDSSFMSLYVIQGDCSISKIRERIMKSVINCQDAEYPGKMTFARLRCRATEKLGFCCWETLPPMDFCIDDHVRYITNDPSAVLTQEQVLREIQKFADQPLPTDAPQWQILVVPKFLYSRDHDYYPHDILEDDGFGNFDTITVKKPMKNGYRYGNNHNYALVWRINHALMDGLSASNILQHCIADYPVKLSIDPLQTFPVPLGLKILVYLRMLVFGARAVIQSMVHRDLNCFHGPGLTGPKTLGWSRVISLDAIKHIKRKNADLGATTTAIFASSVGTSLRGLALRKNNPIPPKIRTGVTCALLPYPNIRPQNRFTVAHLKLDLATESYKDRLKYASNSARRLVANGDIIKNYRLIALVGMAPKCAIPWLMDNCEATVLISNIPGPMEEYTMFQGDKLVDVIGWNTIKGNTAIGVCIYSYAGRLRIGVIADGAVMPSSSDVPNLLEELEKEIVHLGKEADLQEKDVFKEAIY